MWKTLGSFFDKDKTKRLYTVHTGWLASLQQSTHRSFLFPQTVATRRTRQKCLRCSHLDYNWTDLIFNVYRADTPVSLNTPTEKLVVNVWCRLKQHNRIHISALFFLQNYSCLILSYRPNTILSQNFAHDFLTGRVWYNNSL